MVWRKIRKIMAILIFLALIAGTYVFVAEKIIAKIKARKNQIQEIIAIQEYQRKRMAEIPNMKDDFEMAERSEEKLSSFLDKNNAVDFIQEIESLSEGANSRVAIEVVQAEAPAKGKATAKDSGIIGSLPFKDYLQFRIKTAGSFLDLVKFINRLENSMYYADVVSIQINANPEAEREKEKENQESINPFVSRNKANSSDEKSSPISEEVISSIGVVVYTQNQ